MMDIDMFGTNPDNYVCFGTTDKSACTANQDKYMYRVIRSILRCKWRKPC